MKVAEKWTELENIVGSEISQIQKDKCLMLSLTCGPLPRPRREIKHIRTCKEI